MQLVIVLYILKTLFFTKVISTTTSTEATTTIEALSMDNITCDFSNATCEEYNTSITPNEIVATEFSSTILTSIVPPVLNISKTLHNKFLENEICSCDLEESTCDINCCCDGDCSQQNKLVFDYCKTESNRIYDTRYCQYSMLRYRNHTPYEWKINQNSLLCIMKNNLPPEYSFHDEVLSFSDNKAKLHKANTHHWKSKSLTKSIPIYSNANYRYGDYIWIVQNNIKKILNIPSSLEGTAAVFRRKVKYLQKTKTKCIQTDISNRNDLLDINYFIANVAIISNNQDFNAESQLQNCSRTICIPVEAQICDNDLNNCRNITKFYEAINFTANCTIRNQPNDYICHHLLKKLRYVIFHNGTNGIKRVDVLFSLHNLTFNIAYPIYLMQEFEIDYVWINATRKYSYQRSGNPGYLVGKPIMVGKVEHNLKKKRSPSIIRNPLDIASNFLVLSMNKDGICVLNNNTNTIVNFGYNMIVSCKIVEFLNITNTTAKHHCEEIQKVIFKVFGDYTIPSNVTTIFAKFGNADGNKIDDWKNITFTVKPEVLLMNVSGRFSPNNLEINCHNLYSTIKIDIFHARQVVKNLHNQEKIVGLVVSFDNQHNKSFTIHSKRIALQLHLRSEVMFYDVTTEKKKLFLGPPSIDIKLPYDFFYPFVKVKSKSSKAVTFHNLQLYSLLLLFYMYCQ